jgi:hypothetical protein
MSYLPPILNSGYYHIQNVLYGSIRDDEGALGAIGTSKAPELIWKVTRSQDPADPNKNTYSLASRSDPDVYISANPGGVISEIEKRFYINADDGGDNVQDGYVAAWRIQPIIQGYNKPIAFVIYQVPDGKCPDLGHWELNDDNKKEPVKLNRDPTDEENWNIPVFYGGNALWKFQSIDNPDPKKVVNPYK